MEHPAIFGCFEIARSSLKCLSSLPAPTRCTTQSVRLFLPHLLSAAQQRHSFLTATGAASVYMYLCFSVVYAVTGTQYDERGRWCFFFSKAAALPRSHKIGVQQYSRSDTTAALLQALASVPVATVYMCVAGAQKHEIEPRQHLHARCNRNQTHTVPPHTRHTSYQVHHAWSSGKSSTVQLILVRMIGTCSPLSICGAPCISGQPHPEDGP